MKRLVDIEFEIEIIYSGYYWWVASEIETEDNYSDLEIDFCNSRIKTKKEAIKHARAFAELNGLKFKIEGEENE